MTSTSRVTVQRWPGTRPDADPARAVLALPGRRFPVDLPPLARPLDALAGTGWTIWTARWHLDDADEAAQRAAVAEATGLLDDASAGAATRLVVAKSLGTLAAGWAADHAVPAAWLTPVLTDAGCAADIARSPAPRLLLAGRHDHTWDDEVAATSGAEVVRLGDCDHALRTGDAARDEVVVGRITAEVTRFAAAL